MYGLSASELRFFKKLNSAKKIQDYLETVPANFADTCYSPRLVMEKKKAHCVEGALLAATAFLLQKQKPLLLDLRSQRHDQDHVVALYRQGSFWGAVSKTNHAVLRFRDPIYRSVREVAMSYFHEYFLDSGKKTLLQYSAAFDLRRFLKRGWITDSQDLWYLVEALDWSRHYPMVPKNNRALLRPADPIEIQAGKIVRWKKGR